ncbi:MAG: helix-turn-helix transcriptional regulator [Eubacterium sp.]|nr:helix-turn-helix transcriptional regulator [Eubacterium sp.]
MNEQEFKNTVAGKIAYYRKKAGLTQGQLAEVLSYSDKSVSKWERGDGLPDAYVLYKIADYFGVTVNDLISESDPVKADKTKERRRFVPVLSVGLAWLTASVVFFLLKVLVPTLPKEWLSFIYAIPVSFIIATVFSTLWFDLLARCVSVSGIIWGVFVSVLLTFPIAKVLYLIIICAVFQIIVILWFVMRYRTKSK